MNMRYKDWNKACAYANKVSKEISHESMTVRSSIYYMYDGRKGIHLQVYDEFGNFYVQFATGICGSLEEIKRSIDLQAKRIKGL